MHFPAFVDLTCQLITELARDYMTASALSVHERARFEQHLHACPWCMTYLQQLAQTARAARALADDTTPPDADRLLALFRSAPSSTAPLPPTPRPAPPAPPITAVPTSRSHQPADRWALKFLARGAVGPISRFAWPRPRDDERPGAWVEIDAPPVPCQRGIHAVRASELAHWLHDELWLVELGGEVRPGVDALVATRGRLVREVTGWSFGGALRFAHAAYDHAAAILGATPARDAERCLAAAARTLAHGDVALTAFCAALAVARGAGVDRFDQAAYDAERQWQSTSIARDLQLDAQLEAPA